MVFLAPIIHRGNGCEHYCSAQITLAVSLADGQGAAGLERSREMNKKLYIRSEASLKSHFLNLVKNLRSAPPQPISIPLSVSYRRLNEGAKVE